MRTAQRSIICGVIFYVLSAMVQAQTCPSNLIKIATNARYQIQSDPRQIKDVDTGLIWQRCSLGQLWNGTTCFGVATTHTWLNALVAANNVSTSSGLPWRLPNIKELASLVETGCYGPAINTSMFPNTPILPIGYDGFWSSTTEFVNYYPSALDRYAYVMYSAAGEIPSASFKSLSFYVRLVR